MVLGCGEHTDIMSLEERLISGARQVRSTCKIENIHPRSVGPVGHRIQFLYVCFTGSPKTWLSPSDPEESQWHLGGLLEEYVDRREAELADLSQIALLDILFRR